LRVLGSRYLDRSASHNVPCLYAEHGALQLDCSDGKQLTLTHTEFNGAALTAESFVARFGSAPFPLF
jgi:hypothetical protein